MSVADFLQEFFIGIGVDWVLLLLLALSVTSLGVALERWVFYWRRRVTPEHLRDILKGRVEASARDSVERHIAEYLNALGREETGRNDAEALLETELRKERQRYERGLTFLATLGNNAPFIGLLGTVLGIMAAFYSLSEVTDAAEKNLMLMRSISEALIATAVGLLVAIPAVLFYNAFRKRVGTSMEQAREVGTHYLRCFSGGDHGERNN